MKALTLAIALATGVLAAAPALTAQAAMQAPAKSDHGLKAGDRMPGQYTRNDRFRITDVANYSLTGAPVGYRWLLVNDTAYLVQDDTDIIVAFRKVTRA